jgi:hypothetical protein
LKADDVSNGEGQTVLPFLPAASERKNEAHLRINFIAGPVDARIAVEI